MTKSQKNLRYAIYGTLGLVAAGLLAYFLVVRPIQIHNQKLNFDKAEASIDVLASQIQTTIGNADGTKKEKTCGRAHLKSERGPLGCDINLYLLYKNKNTENANDLMQKVSALGSSEIRIGSGSSKGKAFISASDQRGEQIFYQSFNSGTPLSCAYSYTYPDIDYGNFLSTHQENLRIGLSCGGPAMQEFFPLEN